jgi:hypothetical protein
VISTSSSERRVGDRLGFNDTLGGFFRREKHGKLPNARFAAYNPAHSTL